jgi:multicomponent Na+:H+ antiporter subunit E
MPAPPINSPAVTAGWMGAAVLRGVGFLLFWLVLAGFKPSDLPPAAIAVAAATWASLRLLPPGGWKPSPVGLARLMLRFPLQSVLAGVDVAWRVLRPTMRIRPGFVVFPPQLPAGNARIAFATYSSLLPGTLPIGPTDSGGVLVHCLDTGQPVVAQLRAEEIRFSRAIHG